MKLSPGIKTRSLWTGTQWSLKFATLVQRYLLLASNANKFSQTVISTPNPVRWVFSLFAKPLFKKNVICNDEKRQIKKIVFFHTTDVVWQQWFSRFFRSIVHIQHVENTLSDFHNNGIHDETFYFLSPQTPFHGWTFLSLYFQSLEELPSSETLSWADGLVLVYSITDRFARSPNLNICHRQAGDI